MRAVRTSSSISRRVRRPNPPVEEVFLWSNPTSWGGSVPTTDENVEIPAGDTYRLDEDTASIGYLSINGTLEFDDVAGLLLKCKGILVGATGKLKIGTVSTPHPGWGIELTGSRPAGAIVGRSHDTTDTSTGNPNDSIAPYSQPISRGIVREDGGEILIYSEVPAVHRTKLNASASAAATSLTLADSVTWPSGAEVIIGPTGYYANQNTELFTLSGGVSGTSATISAGLADARYGVLQYATDAGISTTNSTFSDMRADADQSNVIDERAEVALLTRVGQIYCTNDTEWSAKRYGVHIMVMGLTGKFIMDGVEIKRGGQGGLLGRYPIHWHMNSYDTGDGENLGDLVEADNRVENCVINVSTNRGITMHGCRGAQAINNVMYDILGHSMFLEDGSEEVNTIDGNWVGKVRSPEDTTINTPDTITVTTGSPGTLNRTAHGYTDGMSCRISSTGTQPSGINSTLVYYVINSTANTFQISLTPGGSAVNITSAGSGTIQFTRKWLIKFHDASAAGFWLTNLNNTITNNRAFDCVNVGFWNSLAADRGGFPGGCFGASSQVDISPFYTPPLDYNNNVSHSNGNFGAQTNFGVSDEEGNTVDGPNNGPSFRDNGASNGALVLGVFSRFFLWKNQDGGYQNRVENPHYDLWVQADNLGTDFFGATLEDKGAKVTGALMINVSANTETAPASTPNVRNCFASYHSALDFIDISAYGYTATGFTPVIAANMPYSTYFMLFGGGVMQTWDLYQRPVEMGLGRHSNWKLFDSDAFMQTPPAHAINDLWDTWTGNQTQDTGGINRRWSLAGAVYDHNNISGKGAGTYHIFKHPFQTQGVSKTDYATSHMMMSYTTHKFYGVRLAGDDLTSSPTTNLFVNGSKTFTHLDSSLNVVSGAVWDIPTNVGTSFFGPLQQHAAFGRGSIIRVRTENGVMDTYLRYKVYNCSRKNGTAGETEDDYFYLEVEWDGSVPARVFASVGLNGSLEYNSDWDDIGRAIEYSNSVANWAALQSAGVYSIWQDTANDLLYIKVGSIGHAWSGFPSGSTSYEEREWDLVVKPA